MDYDEIEFFEEYISRARKLVNQGSIDSEFRVIDSEDLLKKMEGDIEKLQENTTLTVGEIDDITNRIRENHEQHSSSLNENYTIEDIKEVWGSDVSEDEINKIASTLFN